IMPENPIISIMETVLMASVLIAICCAGCVKTLPVREPASVFSPESVKKNETQTHLEGIWENTGKEGKRKQLVFETGGTLKFEDGLTYFNPGQWQLDQEHHELKITLPQ